MSALASAADFSVHQVLEALAYAAAGLLYLRDRRRAGDALADPDRLSLIVAAAVGAAIGSRALYWLCDPGLTARHWREVSYLAGGKTIVGALLGGLIAVELRKRAMGVIRPTGDLYVLPLCAGIAIGRVGCFLAGPLDHTAGRPTALPWGIAWGDSIRRHPTALYEVVFVLFLAWLLGSDPVSARPGLKFALFLSAYLAFRLAIDFLKPEPPPLAAGLTAIQLACIAGLIYYSAIIPRRLLGAPEGLRT
ncbi:MAG: prolipoprotein diacylglyceryl transferase family protein [Acidobacteriota bacterium]